MSKGRSACCWTGFETTLGFFVRVFGHCNVLWLGAGARRNGREYLTGEWCIIEGRDVDVEEETVLDVDDSAKDATVTGA
jgi:hypothetical protein